MSSCGCSSGWRRRSRRRPRTARWPPRSPRRPRAAPEATRRRLGLGAPALPEARRRLGVILEMLRGVPPGGLAARERIPEPGLYRLRGAALAAAESALAGEVADADDGALAEAIARMGRA